MQVRINLTSAQVGAGAHGDLTVSRGNGFSADYVYNLRETLRRHYRRPDLPVGFVIQGATKTDLPAEVIAGYEAPFPTAESKAGAAEFPLLVPTEEDAPGAEEMRAVADALSRWEKPALIAFSDSDPVFPHPKSGEVFCERIPGARPQVTIEGAAHFLQEDQGEQIAREILAFLSE